jgi:hypothetical protein
MVPILGILNISLTSACPHIYSSIFGFNKPFEADLISSIRLYIILCNLMSIFSDLAIFWIFTSGRILKPHQGEY